MDWCSTYSNADIITVSCDEETAELKNEAADLTVNLCSKMGFLRRVTGLTVGDVVKS